MVTENVDIRFRESGVRVIKRKIDEIGHSADRAARGVFLLQRALFVLGGTFAIRSLTRQFDILTNYENRLRLTAKSAKNLEEVQAKLFEVANKSRSSFESVAEIYSRTALSVKDLGISQKETLEFTERLAKATIISGASAREAHAALIQLGQGMASNTLRGDELRSVLEQLPYVADIIAKHLGITRGELRQFGKEGKISAQTVLDAFREAGAEIDQLFANTIPTIGQAITIFGNKIQGALDHFDDATGFSAGVAKSIIAVGDALSKLVTVAAVAAVALIGVFGDKVIRRISTAAKSQLEFSRAVRTGTAVLLDSAKAEAQRAAAMVQSAKVEQQMAASRQAELQQRAQMLAMKKAELQQTLLETEYTIANGRARNIATGQYVNLTTAKANLERVSKQLSIVESVEAATLARLAGARAKVAATTTALTTAQARLAATSATASRFTARLATTFPLLAKGAAMASRAVQGLFSFLMANPLTVFLVAVTGAAFALQKLRDASDVVNKVVANTDDLMRKVTESMKEADEKGVTLAETFTAVSEAQLQLQRVEALEAQREAIRALSDQLVGFNALWQDLKTIVTADKSFYRAATQVKELKNQLQEGEISLGQFRDRLATLAAEVDNARFTEFTRGLVDAIDAVETSQQQIEILDAVIATMAGTATASQTNLLQMASGLDTVTGSANAASDAISFFVSQIPAMKQAAKISATLNEARGKLSAGLADLEAQHRSGELSALDLIAEQQNLNKLYSQAVSEIDGTAEAQRRATSELKRYTQQAELAGKSGLERTIARATQEYQALKKSLIEAGASQAELTKAEQAYQAIVEGAKANAAKKGSGGGGGASRAQRPDFAKKLAQMKEEIELLGMATAERERAQEILAIEKELKRSLTEQEKALADETLRSLQAARTQAEVLQEIMGPRQEIAMQQQALNELFRQGRIDINDYTVAIREMQTAADEASGTLAGGFRSSISGAIKSASELGKALGDIVVGAADKAADAIVEFAKTGKFNMKLFFRDLFAQITKLIAKQLILKALGFVFGVPLGGSTGGGGKLGILGMSSGGSILPTGPGSTDSQIVTFAKRPDERIDVLTPGQQAAQRNQQDSTVVVSAPPVNVAAVISPNDVVEAFDNDEGETMVINIIQRNASTVKNIVGG